MRICDRDVVYHWHMVLARDFVERGHQRRVNDKGDFVSNQRTTGVHRLRQSPNLFVICPRTLRCWAIDLDGLSHENDARPTHRGEREHIP